MADEDDDEIDPAPDSEVEAPVVEPDDSPLVPEDGAPAAAPNWEGVSDWRPVEIEVKPNWEGVSDWQPVQMGGPIRPPRAGETLDQVMAQATIPGPMGGEVEDAAAKTADYGAIVDAFGSGWKRGQGSGESAVGKFLDDKIMGMKDSPLTQAVYAADAAVLRPMASAFESAFRTLASTYYGVGDGLVEAGYQFFGPAGRDLAQDLLGMLDANAGSPGHIISGVRRVPRPVADAYDAGVIGPPRPSPIAAATPKEAAGIAIQPQLVERGASRADELIAAMDKLVEERAAAKTPEAVAKAEEAAPKPVVREGVAGFETPDGTFVPASEVGDRLMVPVPVARELSPTPQAAAEAAKVADEALAPPKAVGLLDEQGALRLERITTGDDLKTALREITEYPGLQAARAGDIPDSHVAALAEIAGLNPKVIDRLVASSAMPNDQVTKVVYATMAKTIDEIRAAAKQALATRSVDDSMKVTELRMKLQLLTEQTMGIRAQWGRTGNVMQDFYAMEKDAKALGKFLNEVCY